MGHNMRQLTAQVFGFSGLLAGRVYVIVDADGITLIDAGLPFSPRKIERQMATHGYHLTDIKRILITHAHTDHVGGLPELQRQSGAQVFASAIEKPMVEGREMPVYPPRAAIPLSARWMARDAELLPGTPVDVALSDGDTIPDVLDGLQAIFTPGHTPGHLAFWCPSRKLLFCGDVVLRLIGYLQLPFHAFTPDMMTNIESVNRIAALQPDIICFGHGNPLLKDATAILNAFAAQLDHPQKLEK